MTTSRTTLERTPTCCESCGGGPGSSHPETTCEACRADLAMLRAVVAMRTEDARIARRHADQAGLLPLTPSNHRAWLRAERWAADCAERERRARIALREAVLS